MIWLLVAWIVFSLIFAEIAPILVTGLGYLVWFVVLIVWTAIKLVFRLPVLMFVAPFRLLADALLFIRLLVSEMRSTTTADDHDHPDAGHDDHHDEHQTDDHGDDDRTFAMRMLGLEPGFSETALTKAYRKAIAAAHPDSPGGSEEAAKQINAARDLLRRSHRRL